MLCVRMQHSIPIDKLTVWASVDRSNHVIEVGHAHVEAAGFSEQAVIKLLLILLCVIRGVSNGVAVLSLGVAPPHAVQGLLAGQEII